MKYHEGEIKKTKDGTYTASYLCKRSGKPYQALAGQGRGFESEAKAKAAIDEANGEQQEYLGRFDAMTYKAAHKRGMGTRWPRPSFWGQADEVLTVAHVGRSYLVSRCGGNLYLSMGDADCECIGPDTAGAVQAFVKNFESPVKVANSCHYCGMAATGINFFGEPVCRECGG
jgi:hypothetical protein